MRVLCVKTGNVVHSRLAGSTLRTSKARERQRVCLLACFRAADGIAERRASSSYLRFWSSNSGK